MGYKGYAYLLENEDVKRWFDNLAAKSYLKAIVYLRNLGFIVSLIRLKYFSL